MVEMTAVWSIVAGLEDMTDAWEEATPWDFCDCGDTYNWSGTSLDAPKGYLLSYNRLSVPLEHKAFKTR